MRKAIIKTAILTLLLIPLMSSCKIGKKYTRPELNLPEAIDPAVTDSASVKDVEWQTLYSDPLLQDLIYKALDYNKDLKIAVARVKELAAIKRIRTSDMLPAIGGQFYVRKETQNYGHRGETYDDQIDLVGLASWELDIWGKLRWAKDKSVAEFLASVENQRAVRITIISEVAKAYFELVALDNELKIVRQTLDSRTEGVRLAEIRYRGGLTSEIVYQQAKLELARTETLVPDLERQIALKENEIAYLSGDYPHDIRRTKDLAAIPMPENLPIGLPSTLLQRRPDVRAAEQELIAANADVGIALTSMFPSLRLTGQFGAESETWQDLLKSPFHQMIGNLLTPLFGTGQNIAAHKARKAAYEGEVAHYEKVVIGAFRDVSNAITNFNKIKEICQLRDSYERASKSAMELAQLQYLNGVIAYLDLLDVQRGYFDAQISLSNAIRDKQIMLVNLYKALGGGW